LGGGGGGFWANRLTLGPGKTLGPNDKTKAYRPVSGTGEKNKGVHRGPRKVRNPANSGRG